MAMVQTCKKFSDRRDPKIGGGVALRFSVRIGDGFVQQILWAEVIVKAMIGAVLIIAPLTSASVLGLHRPDTGFWPRLCAGLIVGIAAGTWAGIAFPNVHGAIGPGGLIPINLAAASMLIGSLILGHAAPSRRGKIVVAMCAIILVALAFLEIAHL